MGIGPTHTWPDHHGPPKTHDNLVRHLYMNCVNAYPTTVEP